MALLEDESLRRESRYKERKAQIDAEYYHQLSCIACWMLGYTAGVLMLVAVLGVIG